MITVNYSYPLYKKRCYNGGLFMKGTVFQYDRNKKLKRNRKPSVVVKKHLIVFIVSFAVVAIGTFGFKFAVGSIAFHKSTMLRMLLLLLIIFTVLELAI